MAGGTGVRAQKFQGGGANNGRQQWIFRQLYQARFSLGPPGAAGGDDGAVMGFAGLAVPFGVMVHIP